jgi:hypothetical protein
LDSYTTLAVVERFDSNHLGQVFTVTAVTGEMIREGHQQAHAFLVVLTPGEEVESFAGNITGCRDLFKRLTTRYGRDKPHGFARTDSTAPAVIQADGVPHKKITAQVARLQIRVCLSWYLYGIESVKF